MRTLGLLAISGAEERRVTVGDITFHISISQSATSRILKRLREGELVTMDRSERNKRAADMELTEKGRRTLTEHLGLNAARMDEVFASMPEEE